MTALLQAGCRAIRRQAHHTLRHNALTRMRYSSVSIETLRERFRDPTSPFHLPPGTEGPDSPDPPADPLSAAEEGRAVLREQGYDPESFWEQPVVWGDQDSFQHVNNVRYVRYFESGRLHWIRALGNELGGAEKVDAMIKGKGISLILKSFSINFKHPVVYPDTLLVAHKPHFGQGQRSGIPPRQAKTHFFMAGAIWSYAQRRIVTESDSVIVWYDYDKLAKCDPGEVAKAAILRRANLRGDNA